MLNTSRKSATLFIIFYQLVMSQIISPPLCLEVETQAWLGKVSSEKASVCVLFWAGGRARTPDLQENEVRVGRRRRSVRVQADCCFYPSSFHVDLRLFHG